MPTGFLLQVHSGLDPYIKMKLRNGHILAPLHETAGVGMELRSGLIVAPPQGPARVGRRAKGPRVVLLGVNRKDIVPRARPESPARPVSPTRSVLAPSPSSHVADGSNTKNARLKTRSIESILTTSQPATSQLSGPSKNLIEDGLADLKKLRREVHLDDDGWDISVSQ